MYEVTPNDGEANEVSDEVNASVGYIENICEPALKLETSG
jgi:hypothetical protein